MTPNEYRERALEFAHWAAVARDPEKREQFENLAAAYLRLAEKAARGESLPTEPAGN